MLQDKPLIPYLYFFTLNVMRIIIIDHAPSLFKAKKVKLDLAVLFGGSGLNSDSTFVAQKRFIKSLLGRHKISRDATLLGALNYCEDAKIAMKIGSAINLDMTKKLIDNIMFNKDTCNLTKALEIARNTLFAETNGARRNVPKTLILFIDETMSNLPLTALDAAQRLKDDGIKVVVIALNSKVDPKTLNALADKGALFLPSSLEEMERQVIPVVQAVLPGM